MTEQPPLVRIRCGRGGCRQVVLELFEPPKDWDARVRCEPCRRHDTWRRSFFDEARRRFKRGLDPTPVITHRYVLLAELRHHFYLADTLGKTQEDVLSD